jgi:hypothetical protein
MIKNMTPHPVVVRAADGTDTTIQPSCPKGLEPRVANGSGRRDVDHPLTGLVDVYTPDAQGEIENLPPAEDGVFILVSGMVGDALRVRGVSRPDVLVPGTGPGDGAVRNDKGHIVAVTRLKRVF